MSADTDGDPEISGATLAKVSNRTCKRIACSFAEEVPYKNQRGMHSRHSLKDARDDEKIHAPLHVRDQSAAGGTLGRPKQVQPTSVHPHGKFPWFWNPPVCVEESRILVAIFGQVPFIAKVEP